MGVNPVRAASGAGGLLVALALVACGIGPPPMAPDRDLHPAPDGPVLEPARGETAGTGWAFGVYRSDGDVCFYTVSDGLVQGPACGPMPEEGHFGPFGSGGDLVGGWTYVGGVVAPQVASVQVMLRTGAEMDVAAVPIDEVGADAAAFFTPLEPGAAAVRLVALDGLGGEIERFEMVAP
jgi:hypothetical protein